MTLKDKFYKPLKFRGPDESFLFHGCHHHRHDPKWETPIWKQRGYNSAQECSDGIIDKWNTKATFETVGFLLGDTMFGQGETDLFYKTLDRMKFRELVILQGNHGAFFGRALELTDENGDYYLTPEKKITFMPNYFEAYINKVPLCFSHFPILSWNGQSKSAVHLYCHVHNNLHKSVVGKAYIDSGARCYEVSVENNPYPINFAELKEIMKNKEAVSFDGHSKSDLNPFC